MIALNGVGGAQTTGRSPVASSYSARVPHLAIGSSKPEHFVAIG